MLFKELSIFPGQIALKGLFGCFFAQSIKLNKFLQNPAQLFIEL